MGPEQGEGLGPSLPRVHLREAKRNEEDEPEYGLPSGVYLLRDRERTRHRFGTLLLTQLGNFPSLPQLKEDVFKAPYLEGITTITTTSILETISVLNIGIAKRHQHKSGPKQAATPTDMVFSVRIKCMVRVESE
jgi:hypothetical protein